MTNEDITKAVMNMNKEAFSMDKMEQMLNFVPTADETRLLELNSANKDEWMITDKFFYEISKIKCYEQRYI